MPDPRLAKWAEVLVTYSTAVKPGDVVAITGGMAAEPLLRAIGRSVLRHGGHPVLLPAIDAAQSDLFELGNDEQLEFITPGQRFINTEADVVINVIAASNTRTHSAIDPGRPRRWATARAPLRQTYFERAANGTLRWSLTLFPTAAHAQDADMETDEFAELVYAACKLNEADPIAAWTALSVQQAKLIDVLQRGRDVHIVGPDTNLRLSVAGRTWINSDGKRNFPSGEVFTGPIEDSAEGFIRFTYPMVTNGREIADVRLRFERGLVVDATAARNEGHLHGILETDEGAKRLGEFAFGTNFDLTRFSKNTLLDEKIGGTVHLALGNGYPDSGSTNQSAVHWDLVCDLRRDGRVEVDGEVFLTNGRYHVWDEAPADVR